MQRLQGIAVSPGVAIGEALVMGTEGFRIPRRFVARDAVDDETSRLSTAFAASIEQVSRNRDAVSRKLGREYGAIFEAHLQMLNDVRLRAELEQLIRQRHYSPEYAVSRALRRYVKVFQSLDNSYLAERATDIIDIEKRLLRNLLGLRREEISSLTSPVLIMAHNLTPSEVANLDRQFVLGFVTEEGGSGSHSAIVAQGLEIPAVVGAGAFLTDVSGGDLAIIDGDHGQVILQPDEETIARYRRDAEHNRSQEQVLTALRDLPAMTLDGTQIDLMGNIEFPHEVRHCVSRGAAGIGLYRTEFLYLGVDTPPDEEVHFQSYSGVCEAMGPKPVVVRTFDLGADKVQAELPTDDEKNPFLGLRSIRLALRNLPIFRTQLRAILRASVKGNVRVMFPLIATMRELRQAKMVLADVMEDLEERGEEFNRKIPIGMMVEVPAAVMMLDHFADEVDFFSIGTNDLIQYTLAVDRSNKDVADLYSASDPAVLKLIKIAIDSAKAHNKPVNLCGQMSGNTTYTMLLVGMGLRQLSVPSAVIPEIKRICRGVTLEQCQAVTEHALGLENALDVTSYLKEQLKKAVPDAAE
jgi:phosphotransferase system enzyme I (PtsI)